METNVTKGSIKLFVSGSTGKMGQSLSDTLVKKQKEDDPFYEFLEIVSFDFIENKELWISSVIIDFSEAFFSLKLLKQAVTKKIPMIIGTTGFDEAQHEKIKEASKQIPLVLAPNTSLGITVLKEMLYAVKNHLDSHKIEIIEKHHKDKKDLPSGTSKDIAKFIENNSNSEKISIESIREDESAGEHSVSLLKEHEVLTISHKVTNRSVYSEGALLAAVWLDGKRDFPGLYQMSDIYAPFEEH
jgi:4-hydroxy-tetrahydrodipicolinate reductase